MDFLFKNKSNVCLLLTLNEPVGRWKKIKFYSNGITTSKRFSILIRKINNTCYHFPTWWILNLLWPPKSKLSLDDVSVNSIREVDNQKKSSYNRNRKSPENCSASLISNFRFWSVSFVHPSVLWLIRNKTELTIVSIMFGTLVKYLVISPNTDKWLTTRFYFMETNKSPLNFFRPSSAKECGQLKYFRLKDESPSSETFDNSQAKETLSSNHY